MSKISEAVVSTISPKPPQPSRTRLRPRYAVPPRYRNRPYRIRNAICRVWELAGELDLTRSTVAVAQAILAAGVSDSNPEEKIFARKSTLASFSNVSEATVYRAINALSEAGFLVRERQPRLRDGSLDIAQLSLTRTFLELLGLVVDSENQGSTAGDAVTDNSAHESVGDELTTGSNAQLSVPQIGFDAGVIQAGSGGEDHGAVTEKRVGLRDGIYINNKEKPTATVNNQSDGPSFVVIEGRKIPKKLEWVIREKRLSFGQLFDLMKKAKAKSGQQVEAFIELRSERLRALATSNDCYRYLRKLIDDDIDAGYMLQQRAKKEQQQVKRAACKQAEAERLVWIRERDGWTFSNAQTGQTYTLNASSGLAMIGVDGLPGNETPIKIQGFFFKQLQAGVFPRWAPVVADRATAHERVQALSQRFKLGWGRGAVT